MGAGNLIIVLNKKQIMIEVENTCHDCPFCSYDGYDESYDCSHEDGGRTLAIREDFGAFNKKLEEWKESKDTLFPLESVL